MTRALIFAGQGSQYVGMGRSLYENSYAAKEIFSVAEKVLGSGFLQACFNGPEEILTQTKICQPALFVHGCAAVVTLKEFEHTKTYDFAFGLSVGELTALWAAEVFDLKTGLLIVAERGRLMQKACEETDGAMLCLIGGVQEDIDVLCECANVEKSNMNCPGQIVVAGERKNIEKAEEIAKKMTFKRVLQLNVAGAYHSRLMESASIGFEKFLKDIDFSSPRLNVLTNVTADVVLDPADIKKMLVKQIVSPVLFEKCCHKAMRLGVDEYFECGPGRSLCGMLKKIDKDLVVRNFDKIEDFNF